MGRLIEGVIFALLFTAAIVGPRACREHEQERKPAAIDCPTAPCTSVRGTTNHEPWSVKRGSAEPEKEAQP